jgi:ATP-dependent 26S proteasome regulatory subunit
MLREELQLLQEQGSYVGEIVKAMDKKEVLVKVSRLIERKNDNSSIKCLFIQPSLT